MYTLEVLGNPRKYLKKLKDRRLLDAFQQAIDEILQNPYIGQTKTGNLKGYYGLDVYCDGVNYEIAYRIYEDATPRVIVTLISTRENFYKELARWLKQN